MSFDEFIKTAWQDHGDHPAEVADRLAASLHLVEVPDQIPAFTGLATHVLGEHLGDWQRGVELLDELRGLPVFDGSATISRALARGVAALRLAGGDAASLASLPPEDRISALANAAAILAGRQCFKPALAAYREALELAKAGLPPGSAIARALAIGGNNLAAALEEKSDRDTDETNGMVVAAEGGLTYWKQAGTWLEEERAEYRLTRSLLQAGRPQEAVRSAERCVEVCRSSQAPAFEQFFGYAALALAQRAAGGVQASEESRSLALRQLEQVPAEERKWCESDLAELGG